MSVTATKLNAGRPLKVVICGLLDKEFRRMADEFRMLDLRHIGNQNHGSLHGALIKGADRVLYMTKFNSHSKDAQMDWSKTVLITGGLTQLRAKLREATLFAARFRYEPPTLSLPIVPANVDFSALFMARAGETLTYLRPERMPAHVFAYDVEKAARACKAADIAVGYVLSGGRAVFNILSARPVLAAAEAALLEAPQLVIPAQHRATLMQFWRAVYIAGRRSLPFAPTHFHAEAANAAVRGWLSLFNH